MSEESKAIKRARRWEQGALDRAAKSYARYLRAVEYRKLAEAQDQIEKDTDELRKRIAETAMQGRALEADIARISSQ